MNGKAPVTLEHEWETVEEFLTELKKALVEDKGTIRYADIREYDKLGAPEYCQKVTLRWHNENHLDDTQMVFVDKLGRIVLPFREEYLGIADIIFPSNGEEPSFCREVVNIEPRYEGTRKSSLVIYLTTQENT